MQEDVLRLVVMLAAYGGHEAKNGFRRRRMARVVHAPGRILYPWP